MSEDLRVHSRPGRSSPWGPDPPPHRAVHPEWAGPGRKPGAPSLLHFLLNPSAWDGAWD